MSIRKFAHVGAVTAGAVSLALLGGAFTGAQAHAVSKPAAQGTASGRIQPGGPLTTAGGKQAPRFAANTSRLVSGNWGGYAADRSGVKFRYVSSVFFVPYVDCAATPDSFSGHWVGLDGLENGTVEQDGILAACNGSTPVYQAWWEMFPLAPVYPNISIHAGDSIVATVYYNKHTRKFELTVSDTTDGQHFSVNKSCVSGSTCQRSSAEVISEAPSSDTGILPLTDFRAESYSSVRLTDDSGHRDGMRSSKWNTVAITTADHSGVIMDQPTQIYKGSAFNMYWMAQS